jgi:polyvinyl alcohol dehydrogenase (cytochrome)
MAMRFPAMGGHVGAAAAALLCFGAASCAPPPVETHEARLTAAEDAAHPGRAVYEQNCASCHDNTERSGAPTLESIRTLNTATVRYALELGYMQQQASHLTPEQREQVIDWLPASEGNDDWVQHARCSIKLRRVAIDGAPRTAVSFGLDPANNRSQSTQQSGLRKADMENLELAWAVAFPQTPTMRSQPVIVGDTIFIAATDSARVYALDTGTGCAKWVYASDMTLRSSLAFAEPGPGRPAMILAGDAAGKVHAINAETGAGVWVTDVKLTSLNRITGAPVVSGDRVFAPLSAIEVNYTSDDEYQCCKGQGAVVALDLATGRKLWVGRTMDEATPQRIGRTGTQQWGPSGAIIWSTPVIDERRQLLYAGTGENTSWPATNTSDAIIAYDMATGARKWVFQATSFDIWNYACGRRAANCDWPGEYHSPDFDFGATSMLVKLEDGRELVVAGQKSGVLWALNPDNGQLVWSNRVGRGSASGGVHWGMAFDGTRVFAPLNDPGIPPGVSIGGQPANPNWGPGIHAVNAATGEIEWTYKPNQRDCGADVPAAQATRPAAEWRITPIAAPMMPTPRPATPPAPRVQTVAATPSPAASPSPAAAGAPAPSPTAAAPAAEAPRPAAGGEGGGPGARARCRLGMSPAPLLVDGALVTGTTGGWLRIFDGATGRILFEYQTNREYETVNGLPGHGGSLDSAPYVAGDGTLFVQSGYARFGENPGNVLLAFRPKRR